MLNRSDVQLLSEVNATLQLLSPRNRILSLPVYLIETNQIELLHQWVVLNRASGENVASNDYLEAVCQLHNGETEEAVASFIGSLIKGKLFFAHQIIFDFFAWISKKNKVSHRTILFSRLCQLARRLLSELCVEKLGRRERSVSAHFLLFARDGEVQRRA